VVTSPTSQAVMTREIESLPLDIRDKSPLVDKSKTFATVLFRYKDGKAGVWYRTDDKSSQVYPLFLDKLEEALDFEVVQANSLLTHELSCRAQRGRAKARSLQKP
jgi:hypothetical protein